MFSRRLRYISVVPLPQMLSSAGVIRAGDQVVLSQRTTSHLWEALTREPRVHCDHGVDYRSPRLGRCFRPTDTFVTFTNLLEALGSRYGRVVRQAPCAERELNHRTHSSSSITPPDPRYLGLRFPFHCVHPTRRTVLSHTQGPTKTEHLVDK